MTEKTRAHKRVMVIVPAYHDGFFIQVAAGRLLSAGSAAIFVASR